MKQYVLIPVLSALLAAFACWGVMRSQPQPAAAEWPNPVNDVGWLARELKLSPQQEQQISRLSEQYRAGMAECMSIHCGARCHLGSLIFQPGVTEADMEAALERYSRAMLEAERKTLQYFQAVYQRLTPEQQAKYTPMIQQCICGMSGSRTSCSRAAAPGGAP